MTGLALIAGLLLAPVAASGCSKPVTPTFEVLLGVQPVTVSSEMHVEDLAAMAAGSHVPLKHPAYGYYVGTFGYTIKVVNREADPDLCPHDVRVRVFMGIAGRHIEIAQELKDNPCLYSRYLDHYKKHAASDVAVITDYRAHVNRALRSMTIQIQGSSTRPEDQIFRSVRAIIDEILMPLTPDRVAVSKEVDSYSEVAALERGCSHCSGTAALDPS